MATTMPSKKQTLLAYLQRGVTMVHLDARKPGVVVPPQYSGEAHLRLNLSYRYSIPDLEIGEERVQATLSFGGMPFQCQLPWDAIFLVSSNVSGDGQVWPEDVPAEVLQTLLERQQRSEVSRENGGRSARTPLRPVEGETDRRPEATAPRPGEAPKRPPHLRLVR